MNDQRKAAAEVRGVSRQVPMRPLYIAGTRCFRNERAWRIRISKERPYSTPIPQPAPQLAIPNDHGVVL